MVLRCRGDGLGMATSAVGLGISPPTSQSLRGSKRRHVASKRRRPTLPCHSRHDAYLHFGVTDRHGKQSALEETSERDSTAAGEARQGSKPRPTIPGLEGRAAHRTVLERHAGRHRASRSSPGHEAIPGRSQPQAGAGADYARHGPAMDGWKENVRAREEPQSPAVALRRLRRGFAWQPRSVETFRLRRGDDAIDRVLDGLEQFGRGQLGEVGLFVLNADLRSEHMKKQCPRL
jgi:hypothetical protein